jgi:hypothetical protein
VNVPPGIVAQWQRDGFVVLPGLLTSDDISDAVAGLPTLFPTAEGFHQETDERHVRYRGNEFAGIDSFPLANVDLSLLCVHPTLVALARSLLGTPDVRIYSAEAWAKYTGASEYDQPHHRDFLNHTLTVPSSDPAFRQAELFVFLSDSPESLGPTHLVSMQDTATLPLFPNWRSAEQNPDLYAGEVSGAGPRGTVIAFSTATVHRGTQLREPGGARYTLHVNFRRADAEWAIRGGWADISHDPAWYDFVERASVDQLQLFGFPPPGHPFWTVETLTGTKARYPSFDPGEWRQATT